MAVTFAGPGSEAGCGCEEVCRGHPAPPPLHLAWALPGMSLF